jgi:predicted DNA-binding protein (MmcQ/YjbR family)
MKERTPPTARVTKVLDELRAFALTFPDAREETPWGDIAIKVRGKTFVFMGADGNRGGISTKLPESGALALALPFAEPTGYGLGKSGWVSARFGSGPKDPPLDTLRSWIRESYGAIAPKKLLAALGAGAAKTAPARTRSATPRRKTATAVRSPRRR